MVAYRNQQFVRYTYLPLHIVMFSYIKCANHHIGEVEALVEKFLLPKFLRYLQCTKEQIKPELVELFPVLGKGFATEFANKHTFVCENEKRNIVGALFPSYMDQEDFMYHVFHKCESYLKLQIKHDMPAKKFALTKIALYRDVKLFEKNDSGKVLFLKHGIVHPKYRRVVHRTIVCWQHQ